MNDEQPGPHEAPTAPVPPAVPPTPPPAPPSQTGPIDWTPRTPDGGAVPPPPPPPPAQPPQWAPPNDPTPTAVQPTVPPYPAGPPTGPPLAPPDAWNQPPGAPPLGTPVEPTTPPTSKKTGLIIGVLVVLALIIGGIVAAAVVLMDSDPQLTLDIEVCEIAADGTMTASGSVENTSGSTADVDIDVVFRNDATSSTVDTDTVELNVPGDSGERWSLSGTAGDDVQRISCDVTADD